MHFVTKNDRKVKKKQTKLGRTGGKSVTLGGR